MPWNSGFGGFSGRDANSALQKTGSSFQLPDNPYEDRPYAGNPVDLGNDPAFQNEVRRQVAQQNGMAKVAEGSAGGGGGNMMGSIAGMMGGGGGGGGGGMLSAKNDAAAGSGSTDKASQVGNILGIFGKLFGMGG